MNEIKKYFQQLYQSIDIVELVLMVLSSGMGLALIHFASYKIKWYESTNFILWMILFFFGGELLSVVLNLNRAEYTHPVEIEMTNLYKLITTLFFSLSIVPLARIIIFSVHNYVVVYLLCILGFWFLIKKINLTLFKIFGMREIISSFMISFLIPLIILNIHGIQIYKIIFPISFFVFIEIIAYQLIRELMELGRIQVERTGQYSYAGFYTFIRTITFLIPFGYISAFFLLYIQGNIHLSGTLLITIPLAVYILIKINQNHDNQNGDLKDLKLSAFIFAFLAEVSWIFGLYLLR
jgi:hypothetical protein